ncbi:hypothetical protein DOS74_02425 [Staphylococcus felis]|uniref:DUF7147 domain-containing protein n=1 Tax=Staphylococcus felis TaxID=46127 RepID=A0AAX1RWL8_9STAP|nr:hypothetical protein [Staphylococcus felis]REH77401.1 hypothetical protein DOS59_07100 [Staphylococcus felis]REH84156.1 hypothetical protein DOS63_07470 [Staphylococcus felis]REH86189.1 hypothetical protein DOS56_00575 [Staphylococcus felis]REI01255.1 hypothetical protein DOS64_04455 [Staphylococcus felis]REI18120.1 hypothetical protein DOS74_02425 [Staphylococcus felis]
MQQSFIVLGNGLTDLFEFKALIDYNHLRISRIVYFHTPKSQHQRSSVAIIMQPTEGRKFQAMYMMLNAFKYPYPHTNQKFDLIQSFIEPYDIESVGVDVHAPDDYPELDLYFNYLKSVLRLQHWIPALE